MIGMLYTLDHRPVPNNKVEKIIGLSEPSPYRLGAQVYIDAKQRGELPSALVQSLPGYKTKSRDKTTPEEAPVETETTDSDATIEYTLPTLPEATESVTIKKGKLHIKKLTLKKAAPNKKSRFFKCVKCGQLFDSIIGLNDHFINKHRNLKCSECDKSFDKPRSHQKHMYLHKKAKHCCIMCGKGFAFPSQLTAHMPVYSGSREHKCNHPKCDKSFTYFGDLKKHLKTHTKKWWWCEVAGCRYKNRDERNLKSHSISHMAKKGFKCKYCNTLFQWSMQLIHHYEKKSCAWVNSLTPQVFKAALPDRTELGNCFVRTG